MENWIKFPFRIDLLQNGKISYSHLVTNRQDALLLTTIWKKTHCNSSARLYPVEPAFPQRSSFLCSCTFTNRRTNVTQILWAQSMKEARLWKEWAEGLGQIGKKSPTAIRVDIEDTEAPF